MLLGEHDLLRALATGTVVCDPPPARIEGTHIDLHLGPFAWFSRTDPNAPIIDIGSDDPRDTFRLVDCRETAGRLILPPLTFALAHTIEAAGTSVPWFVPFIETRSTLARWGIAAHVSAGWGDPGFCGIWTLELFNHRPFTIAIPLGARICSMAVERVSGNDSLYRERYNFSRADWTPDRMLPRIRNV